MKLSLARVTLAALTIGALTACGSGAPSDTTTSSSTAGGAFPRTVEMTSPLPVQSGGGAR
ncbi:hypothetical protein P1N98_17810 [Tsukamurella tyrosinosolvens]|uniref:hypothetical protein n=1 Tax=Tsukamurella tyrosinosolvens TaxID=57704 RepID=UPI0024810EDB|nr:hypothetical protein [Tsukamurella tyrosinosolvens]WEL92990.1 hypothetical protein P1N98_17810 [Tsukamurella tyrosinosolvens]